MASIELDGPEACCNVSSICQAALLGIIRTRTGYQAPALLSAGIALDGQGIDRVARRARSESSTIVDITKTISRFRSPRMGVMGEAIPQTLRDGTIVFSLLDVS